MPDAGDDTRSLRAFEASLHELVRTGRVSREVALAVARDPVELQRRRRG